MRDFILGTAGHIDHGKSTLVERLTGTDPDRLPEEKARGMTIDLGFARLVLEDPAGGEFEVGVVDVPGHADFVKNMVAGVGRLDAVLLVVAADDGWMPQTEEHVQILEYLGVRRGVVALTKADVVEDIGRVVEEVRARLEGTVFAGMRVVPVAALRGEGLGELRTELARVLAAVPESGEAGKPRLPVDRVFSPVGIGTVVTGTLGGGELGRGDEVVVQPSGERVHVRGLQRHYRSVMRVGSGSRVAVQLSDVGVGERGVRGVVGRGDTVALLGFGEAHDTVDAVLVMTARGEAGERRLRHGQRVVWHHGSAEVEAQVLLQGERELVAGGRVVAQLRFEEKVYAFSGDRFVVRDAARRRTLAGGVVLDAEAERARFRDPRFQACRAAWGEAADDVGRVLAALLERDGALERRGLLVKSRWSAEEIAGAGMALVAKGVAEVAGGWLVGSGWWRERVGVAGEMVRAWHRGHPERVGMDAAEFQRGLVALVPDERLVGGLVAALAEVGFIRSGRYVRHVAHRPELPGPLVAAGKRLRSLLALNAVEPPGPGELVRDGADRQALQFLVETGEAVVLDPKAVISAEGLAVLTRRIEGQLRERGRATVAELRDGTGTTRRILIPLLERLDREGVTLREGDWRRLRDG
jgi:selenocysteine-specific elongation factor